MQELPNPLEPLADYNQFLLWKIGYRKGERVKLPVNPTTATVVNPHDLTVWVDRPTAFNAAKLYGDEYNVSFILSDNDPFFLVDIDDCLDDGKWSPLAMEMLKRLQGAAVEVSESGTGLHIIGTGVCPEHCCKPKSGLEFYTTKRMISLTGTNAIGDASFDCSAQLPDLVNDYFPPRESINGIGWTTEPVPEWTGPIDDEELIKKAIKSKSGRNIFGSSCSFKSLWQANEADLIQFFPDEKEERLYDYSSPDMALAQHLAFWTGKNCERMLNLMWLSSLVRDKWSSHKEYLKITITEAVGMQSKVYNRGYKTKNITEESQQPFHSVNQECQIVTGFQYLNVPLQLELFKGCTYIQATHRIFTPSGVMLKSEQFNATYGGSVFQLDEMGDTTTRKAWEAFTESQVVRFPKAQGVCFRPKLKPGELIKEEDFILVNTYVPVKTDCIAGDATPFLYHLAKVLPVQNDRDILLAYMAACIQHKGVKFQWAPLLQGVAGNGKTLFTRCMTAALGRRYTHLPIAKEIAEKFNDWLFEKLFIGVEDVYVAEHKQETIETLKPMITNEFHPVRAMQTGQKMKDNYANFILNSQHKDAIRITVNDRRFCVFITGQQHVDDLKRDGMHGNYFEKLYKWLRDDNGYGIVTHYLTNYAIPVSLNPAGVLQRAPLTSTTQEVIEASMGSVEQEIFEAIEEGRPGFCGGWVSSMALDQMLKDQHFARTVPPNKRREMLKLMGYDWHPALQNGRVNNITLFDGGKPRLFIKNDHIHVNLKSPAEVARVYQEAQGLTAAMMPGITNTYKR